MKKLICILLAAMILALSACGETAAVPSPTPSAGAGASAAPTTSPTAKPTPSPTPSAAPYVNPLSGEPMDEDVGAKRPWAIMINNLDRALPQCGISQAEIIYEVPAEGGVTRMMAIFSDISDVDPIGSIRSIRPYYADIGLSYDAIIVHAGGSEESYTEMFNIQVDHLDGVLGSYADATFYREPSRLSLGYEHSLFTTGEKLIAAANGQKFAAEHPGGAYDYRLNFSASADRQCSEKAEYVLITFNGYKSTSFTYDKESGLYKAFEYGISYKDGNTDQQMTFKNLLVLSASVSVVDDVGRLSIKLTGSGDGYFICGGKYTKITWQREANDQPFIYYAEDGTQLDLGVGNSYIGIMPTVGGSIAFEKK